MRYSRLTYDQVMRNLRVMDMSAISLCREARMPILVFNYKREGNIERAIAGHELGTIVSSDQHRAGRSNSLPVACTIAGDDGS